MADETSTGIPLAGGTSSTPFLRRSASWGQSAPPVAGNLEVPGRPTQPAPPPIPDQSNDQPAYFDTQGILYPDSIYMDTFIAYSFPFPTPYTPPSLTLNVTVRVLEQAGDLELVYVGLYDGWTFRNNMVNFRGTRSPSAPIADYNSQFPVSPDTNASNLSFSGSLSTWGVADWSDDFWATAVWGVALVFANLGNAFSRTIQISNVELVTPDRGSFHARASGVTYPWNPTAFAGTSGSGVTAGDGSPSGVLPAVCSLGPGRCNTSYLKTYQHRMSLPSKKGTIKSVRVSYIASVNPTAFTQELYFGFFGPFVPPPSDDNSANETTTVETDAPIQTPVNQALVEDGIIPLAESGTDTPSPPPTEAPETPPAEATDLTPATSGGELSGLEPVAGGGGAMRPSRPYVWYNNVTDASVYATTPTVRVYEGPPGFWGVENWTPDDWASGEWGISLSYMKHGGGAADVRIDDIRITVEYEPEEEAPPPPPEPEPGESEPTPETPEPQPETPPPPPPETPTPPETPPPPPEQPLPPPQEPTPPPEVPLPPVQPTPIPPSVPPGVTPGFDPGFIPIVPLPPPVPPKPGEPLPDAFGVPCVSFCVGWATVDDAVLVCAWEYDPLGCRCGRPESHVDKPCPMNRPLPL